MTTKRHNTAPCQRAAVMCSGVSVVEIHHESLTPASATGYPFARLNNALWQQDIEKP